MVVLLLWCSLACVAAISNGAANTITVVSDGNKTNCSTNSSGTFCYSLSYAMNHLITDNTTVLLASPKIDVLDHSIAVSNVSNIALQGLGIDRTIICYYQFSIDFSNISGLQILNLAIKHCKTVPHLFTHKLDLYLFNCSDVTISNVKISQLLIVAWLFTIPEVILVCLNQYLRKTNLFEEEHISFFSAHHLDQKLSALKTVFFDPI